MCKKLTVFISESPPPKDPALFPTWPSKGSGEKYVVGGKWNEGSILNHVDRRKIYSPSAPQGVHSGLDDDNDPTLAGTLFAGQSESAGFRLKLA